MFIRRTNNCRVELCENHLLTEEGDTNGRSCTSTVSLGPRKGNQLKQLDMAYAINCTCCNKEVHSYVVTSWTTCYHNKGKVDNICPFESQGTEDKTSANSIKVSCLESSAVEVAGGGEECCEAAIVWSRGCGKQMSVWTEEERRVYWAQVFVHFTLLKPIIYNIRTWSWYHGLQQTATCRTP